MSFSVIIPSKTAANLEACVNAIRDAEEATRIITVDDAIVWSNANPQIPMDVIRGLKPFVFSRNVNLGIKTAGDDDVVILNDDALLKTPGGFSMLQELAEAHPGFGMIAPVTNVTGARDQMPQGKGLREIDNIAFVCVYIPRRTLNTVGLLDERFTTYGWEDTDYCRRVKQAGLKIGVYDHCFVDHGSLASTFRGHANNAGDIEPGRRIFQEKWGVSA